MTNLPAVELPDWPEPRPRVLHHPPLADWSAGDEAVELAASAGLHLDEWQQWSLKASLGARPDGSWASFEVAEIVPRQDGKGAILEARSLAGLWLFGEQLQTWTAHEFKTAQEAFRRIVALVESTPDLLRKVKRVTTANGDEGLELKTGQRLRFLARSGGSGRGFSGDLVILDEAYKLPAEAMGALVPTMAARRAVTVGGPQLWYTSSAGKVDSEVLAGVRERGIAGGESLTLIEYSAGEPDDHTGSNVDLDDRREWYRANPAMHGPNPRIDEEFVEREREMLTDEEFARERLCLWGTTSSQPPIDPDLWLRLLDDTSKPGAEKTFAVDLPPDRKSASISVASWRPDGRLHVEVVDHRPGTLWVADRAAQLDAKWKPNMWLLDPSGPAGSLIVELTKVGVEPKLTGARDMAAACGRFVSLAESERMVHIGQEPLTAAVDGARKRKLGDAWAWHRRDASVDLSPLVACTLAAHGVDQKPKKARKTGRAMFV